MWYTSQNQQVIILILAKPNAKRTLLLDATEHELRISIHAKPYHGAANIELIAYLSQLLYVPKTQIILKRGEHSHHKQVSIPLTDKLMKRLHDIGKELDQ
jgi:uncharacterized protein (TIGR00251 family)